MEYDDLNLDNYTEVESGHIAGVGTRGEWLVILFKKGSTYRYKDCASQFSDLVSAESVGKYFHLYIKDQHCEKLPPHGWPEDE